MRTLHVFAALACAAALHAQDLAPELVPLVKKYKEDTAALETQKAAALSRIAQTYSVALDGAEKAATAAGKLEVVSSISKEREAMKGGIMPPAFPEELPRVLAPARKAYMDGAARSANEIVTKQKVVSADYLRALAALQSKAGGNAELTKQITAEKENLLSKAAAMQNVPAASGKNVIANGTFDAVDEHGHPRGWILYGPGVEKAFSVIREGSNAILHTVVTEKPVSIGLHQRIPVPPRAKSIVVRGRVRGKIGEHLPDDPNWGANVLARFADADGKDLTQILQLGRPDGGWKQLSETGPIPKGAKTVSVACVGWWVTGTFDFDDIEVEFR